MDFTLRQATAADAEDIARLEQEFVDYLRRVGDAHPTSIDAATYLRDGFGKNPAFSGFAAEIDRQVIGYILYHPGYDIDRGGRVFYIFDFFITEKYRGAGIGNSLMKAVGDACLSSGGRELIWSVFGLNKQAIAFYEHAGAVFLEKENLRYMHLKLNTR